MFILTGRPYQARAHVLKRAGFWDGLTSLMVLLTDTLVFMLPLKLMSAYFGLSKAAQRGYTRTTYWITFGITVCLSLIALITFWRRDGVQERKASIKRSQGF